MSWKKRPKISVNTSSKIIVKNFVNYPIGVLLQATTAFAFIFDFKREDVTGTFLSFHRRCISKNYALHLKNYVSKNYL